MTAAWTLDRMSQSDGIAAGSRARCDASVACEFITRHVRQRAGKTWQQGPRIPALSISTDCPWVRLVAERRLHAVPENAAHALLLWARGFPIALFTSVPSAREILELQANGGRCVSLLNEAARGSAYADPLDFALHDLCHLDKFTAAEHYAEQVGFFRTLRDALTKPSVHQLEAELDDTWQADRDHVLSDMNGSSVYLLAAFKMKLKMAARRRLARERAIPPTQRGPLSTDEESAFRDLLEHWLTAIDFHGPLRHAAHVTSARRDDVDNATLLATTFAEIGRPIAERTLRGLAPLADSAPGRHTKENAPEP